MSVLERTTSETKRLIGVEDPFLSVKINILTEGLPLLRKSGVLRTMAGIVDEINQEGGEARVVEPEAYEGVTKVELLWDFREETYFGRRYSVASNVVVYARQGKDLMVASKGEGEFFSGRQIQNQEAVAGAIRRAQQNPTTRVFERLK